MEDAGTTIAKLTIAGSKAARMTVAGTTCTGKTRRALAPPVPNAQLSIRNSQLLTCNSQLLTRNSQLVLRNSEPAIHNPQLSTRFSSSSRVCSIERTSANCVRHRSRFCPGRVVR